MRQPGRQSDRVAELLKLSDMMMFQPWRLQLFKMVLTQVLILELARLQRTSKWGLAISSAVKRKRVRRSSNHL